MSFLPFPTRLLARASKNENAVRMAATLYGVTVLDTVRARGGVWRSSAISSIALFVLVPVRLRWRP
jgi:hypothetical protein